jgi:hypothetical protein
MRLARPRARRGRCRLTLATPAAGAHSAPNSDAPRPSALSAAARSTTTPNHAAASTRPSTTSCRYPKAATRSTKQTCESPTTAATPAAAPASRPGRHRHADGTPADGDSAQIASLHPPAAPPSGTFFIRSEPSENN